AEVPARSGRIRPHAVRPLCEHMFCDACKPAPPAAPSTAFPHRCRRLDDGVHCPVMVPAGQGVAPLPPQNLDAEESVLGAMLLSEAAIEAASDALDAGDFYRESHGRIYRAALELYQQGRPVD